MRSPYDHKDLVRDYKESTDRNDKIRATQPLESYLARVRQSVGE